MRAATDVPLETMRACAEVLGLGKIVAEHGNPSAASDVGVGLQLTMAGLTGATLERGDEPLELRRSGVRSGDSR